MRDPSSPSAELFDLLEALCQDQITPEQAERLERWVCGDSRAREIYVQYMHLCAHLPRFLDVGLQEGKLEHVREMLERFGSDDRVGAMKNSSELELSEMGMLVNTENIREMLEEDAEVTQREAERQAQIETLAAEKFLAFRREQERHSEPVPVPRNVFYATVSTLVAAAIIGILLFIGHDAEPTFAAKIVGVNGPVWGGMPPETGLYEGQLLDLNAGLVEIEFGDGARVILEGPVEFVIDSPGIGTLEQGKLVAYVGQKSTGFTILTPSARIVDLGTEFGAEVSPDGLTEVHVLKGAVRADMLSKGKQTDSIQLDTGHAARLDVGALSIRRIPALRQRFRKISKDFWKGPVSIPIRNASFETPRVSNSKYVHTIEGWDRTGVYSGVNAFRSDFSVPIPNGRQLAYVNEGEISQTLQHTVAPHMRYELAVWVGNRSKGRLEPNFTIEMRAGDFVLATKTNPVAPGDGLFSQANLSVDIDSDHPALGERMTIALRSEGSLEFHTQNHFDAVQLTVMSILENEESLPENETQEISKVSNPTPRNERIANRMSIE